MTDKKVINRVIKGLSAGALGQIVTVVIQLVAVPILLNYWGVIQYGEWIVISAVTQYLALSNLGFTASAGNAMTTAFSNGDGRRLVEVLQSIFVLYLSLFCFVGIIVFTLLAQIDFQQLFQLNYHTNNDVMIILYLMSFYVLLCIFGGLFDAIYRANLKVAYFITIQNTIRLAEFLVLIVIVICGGNTKQVAIGYVTTRIIAYIFLYFQTLKVCRYWELGFSKASIENIRELFLPSLAFMAVPLGGMLNVQGTTLVVSNLLGPVAVVTLSTGRTITRLSFQILEQTKTVFWPEISASIGTGKMTLARNLHRKLFGASFWISICVVVTLILSGEELISVWTQNQVTYNSSFMNLLFIGIFVNSTWYVSSVIQMATNTHMKQSILYIFANVFTVILAMTTAPFLGLESIGIALIICEIIMAIYVLPASLRYLSESPTTFFIELLRIPFTFYHLLQRKIR
ncbi:hypothetical protein OAA91_01540 [Fibrobacterales bacterium]|nr:hypothetical protein [Fibrobacterales bacterium]